MTVNNDLSQKPIAPIVIDDPSQVGSVPGEQLQRLTPSDVLAATLTGPRTPLPPEVARAKQAVIALTTANTKREDNVGEIREQLQPHLEVLSTHFAQNRPGNEVALTRGSWKSLWYDDPDIDRVGPLKLDRSQIYQVVKDGFYYNVSNSKLRALGIPLGTVQNFLRGNYEIIDPAGPETQGLPRRNVISLEFADNRLWFGKLQKGADLGTLVDRVDGKDKTTIPVPGPRGIQGELWNLYVDADIRISAGVQKGASKSAGEDLYILQRVSEVE